MQNSLFKHLIFFTVLLFIWGISGCPFQDGTTTININKDNDEVDTETIFRWEQEAYIKASNNDVGTVQDFFGAAVDIDGDTMVVGANREDSDQNTITNGTGSSTNDDVLNSGAVYVYKRSGSIWVQEAYIKASNNDGVTTYDGFGYSVAIDEDTIVVGALREDSDQTTITNGTGSSTDNSITDSGAVYVYKRTGSTWVQEAYIKASNNDGGTTGDLFGGSVDISGNTIVVGADREDSDQSTITNGTGSSTNNDSTDSGAVYVYKRTGSTWTQEAYIKASNNDGGTTGDRFGLSVAIYGDTIVVGALMEDSNQNTITNGTGSNTNNDNTNSGAAYVYKRTGTNWTQEAYIKASNNGPNDFFGLVDIYMDTIVVGSPFEASNQTTITNGTGSSTNNDNTDSGAAYIYKRTGSTWTQEAYIKASNNFGISTDDMFGASVAIYGDRVIVGSYLEDSNQMNITNGPESSTNDDNTDSGAAYVYKRTGSSWAQEAYIKASNNDGGTTADNFSYWVSIHEDTIAVTARGEDSDQDIITHGPDSSTNDDNTDSGAVFVYTRN